MYAAGADNSLCQINSVEHTWLLSSHLRTHTHDILALAASPRGSEPDRGGSGSQAGRGQIIVSGGVDTQMVVYRHREFERAPPLKISPFGHRPRVSMARPFPEQLHGSCLSFSAFFFSPPVLALLLYLLFYVSLTTCRLYFPAKILSTFLLGDERVSMINLLFLLLFFNPSFFLG